MLDSKPHLARLSGTARSGVFFFLFTLFTLSIALGIGLDGLRSLASASSQGAPLPAEDASRELSLLLRKLDRTARVLYVTAHPDDEDSGLITRLAQGEGVEVALLSLTRGEGGQNEIGTELFDALGVLRSRELQAAARYAGFRQIYSRAFEFGYSFSVEETFQKWGREELLRDIVQVMRRERPDIVLTMLNDGPGGGQHHQASAQLAEEAYAIAATTQWPELGPVHQAARLFRQIWSENSPHLAHCEMDLGSYDPVLGDTYQGVGLASRAMHKCQGMARLTDPIPARITRWHWASASDEVIGEIDHLFSRLPEPLLETLSAPTELGRTLRVAAEEIRLLHNPARPERILEPLLRYYELVEAAEKAANDPTDRVRLETLRSRAARAIQLSAGLQVVARSPQRLVSPGAALPATVTMQNNSSKTLAIVPGWAGEGMKQVAAVGSDGTTAPFVLQPGKQTVVEFRLAIHPTAESTLPFPMPRHGGGVTETDPKRIRALYHDPRWSSFAFAPLLTIDNRRIELPPIPLLAQELDALFPNMYYADVDIVPDPSVRVPKARVAIPVLEGSTGRAEIEVFVSSLEGGSIDVSLHTVSKNGQGSSDSGLRIEPASQVVDTRAGGAEQVVRFQIELPTQTIEASNELPTLAFEVEAKYSSGARVTKPSRSGYQRVTYPHIRPGMLVSPARFEAFAFPCQATARKIGFIPGSGDRMVSALRQLGYDPTILGPEDLERDLSEFDVLITGVRVYKVREDMKDAQARIMAWVEEGGTLLVQYNKFEFNDGQEGSSPFAPYEGAKVGRRRVTVEESSVVVNSPEHSVFVGPNAIGPPDWAHWVQERGLYFLDVEGERYQDLLTLEDPWELNAGAKPGSLVHAEYGKGHWVYVGVGLFRQLPAGVPGAYRLLANLIALGS